MGVITALTLTACFIFCRWSKHVESAPATGVNSSNAQTTEAPVVPVLPSTNTTCQNSRARRTSRIGPQPLNPIGLGSLYPLPRQPTESHSDATDGNHTSDAATIQMDPPPSYDEVMAQSQVVSSAPAVTAATDADPKREGQNPSS
ncbi:hypothetical protein Trydic_g5203 [Trypoxylus dichotomus]